MVLSQLKMLKNKAPKLFQLDSFQSLLKKSLAWFSWIKVKHNYFFQNNFVWSTSISKRRQYAKLLSLRLEFQHKSLSLFLEKLIPWHYERPFTDKLPFTDTYFHFSFNSHLQSVIPLFKWSLLNFKRWHLISLRRSL